MNRHRIFAFLILSAVVARGARAADPAPFELRDGDKVVFVGNTFFEREQLHGYLETLLTTRWPERQVVFRNIGWSGDTVWGHARAYFDGPEQGFERLKKVVTEIKPTVVFVSYGMGESFDGPAGLPKFNEGLGRMLDMLAGASAPQARFVLLSPIPHEKLGLPLPDPAEHNRSLRLYTNAIAETGKARGHTFVNLFDLLGAAVPSGARITANGVHLTPYGYWFAAQVIEEALGLGGRGDAYRGKAAGPGTFTFEWKPSTLPVPPAPRGSRFKVVPRNERRVFVSGLAPGRWKLSGGDRVIAEGPTEGFAKGPAVLWDPHAAQAEKLRELIVSKNVQFFNRYRPQNETYIFGFRNHEQGKNAREIPMFDKPIAEMEAEIARLRTPKAVTYTMERGN